MSMSRKPPRPSPGAQPQPNRRYPATGAPPPERPLGVPLPTSRLERRRWGVARAYASDDDGGPWIDVGVVFERDGHLSFELLGEPYAWRDDAQVRRIRLYPDAPKGDESAAE